MERRDFGGSGRRLGVLGPVTLAAASAIAALSCPSQPTGPPSPADPNAAAVTPVHDSSWLHHLGLLVSNSRMGEMGGSGPPPATARQEPQPGGPGGINGVMRRFLALFGSNRQEADQAFNQTFELAGADLYRLNCQSCHGPDGTGAPPEINSLLGPVRGTSVAAIEKRMTDRGSPISDEMAGQLAAQAVQGIRDRLQNGGEKMPPFRHLRGDEIEALLGCLDQLAGVAAGDSAAMLVPQSAARVGEHVVKGTCHICHDATGPGGHHVTMPALSYLTEEETAAAYFYLNEYPPGR